MRTGWAIVATGAVWLMLGAGVARANTAASISAVEGQQLNNVVVDTVSSCSPSALQSIMIDWGDGTSSSGGAFETGTNSCGIAGSHTYAEEGPYATDVTYTFAASGKQGSDVGSAAVSDAQPTASGVNDFTLSNGSPLSGAVVADWSDPALEPLASYSATIDWGDGISNAGAIGAGTVSGSHTYTNGGRFSVTVTFKDEGGGSAAVHEHANVSGCPTSPPSAPSSKFNPSQTGLNPRWVQAVWHDVLGRDPNAGEMSAATQALSLGETRTQLALLVLNSAEYRSNEIGSDYAAFLHRAPGQSETSSWLSLLGAGASDEALAAQLIGSAEYYANRGNSSSDGFLSAMYCDAVSRAIDQFSQNNDDAALGAATSRTTITTSLLSSAEYRKQLVGDYYLRYLRRAGSPSELAFFAGLMGSGESDEQVIAAILGSSEYFSLFNPVVAVAKTSVARGGTITTTLSRFATLKLTVLRVLPTGHARDLSHTVDLTIPAPATRRVGVVNFGGHAKGRVKLRWNRKVGRKRLKRGQYLLLLTAYRGHRQIGTSDPLPFTVH